MVICQQNQIVHVLHIQRRGDLLIKGPAQRSVLQLARAQVRQQAMLLAVHDLLRGKGDVDQILIQRPGERLAQQLQILFRLLLRHQTQRLIQLGDDLTGAVDETAVNMSDRVLLRLPPAAQLTQFLLIHATVVLSECSHSRRQKSSRRSRPVLYYTRRQDCNTEKNAAGVTVLHFCCCIFSCGLV